MTIGERTLSFVPSGFTTCVTGNFERGSLPYITGFSTSDPDIDDYQDHNVTYTVGTAGYVGDSTMLYSWTYIEAPAGNTPALTSTTNTFTFNFWEMPPGTYKFRVNMTDAGNPLYYYHHDSTTPLIVHGSCSTECETIIWKFRNDPGDCTPHTGCILQSGGDSGTVSKTGNGPYTLTLTFNPGSVGGHDLIVAPDAWSGHLTSVPCGGNVQYPSLALNLDAPSCQSSGADLILSATISYRGWNYGNAASYYSLNWVPAGCATSNNNLTCTIPSGTLSVRKESYTFEVQIILGCRNEGWHSVTFNAFEYFPIITSSDLVVSVQTISFSGTLTSTFGTCGELLKDASISILGTGATCQVVDNTLVIKYGPLEAGTSPVLIELETTA